MRPPILLLVVGLCPLILEGWAGTQALAAEESKDSTRVAIAVSGGPVAYTDQFRQDPPAIVIEFRSRNVIAALESSVIVNAGILKEIQSDYYPRGRRALKRLTLTLLQPAAYTIAQQANQIVVDIDTPASVLPGRMAVGQGVTVLGIEAKETLLQRLKVMEGALQQAAPQNVDVIAKPQPAVVTKPVEIPKPVAQPEPTGEPVSTGSRGGFWPGVLLGMVGGTLITVAGRRRKRKTAGAPGESAEAVPMTQGASVYEQLILKAVQRQGQKLIGSKAIEGLGAIWIVEKDGARHGVLCLTNGEFVERKVLEQLLEALKQETLPSGTVMALGAFTAPALAFAKECGMALVAREEVLRMINVELQGSGLEPAEAAAHLAGLPARAERSEAGGPARPDGGEGELVQAQERIRHLEQELAGKVELYATLSQEADQLKTKSAEVDQRLATEQEKRTQLEGQLTELEEQLEVQAAARAENEAKETVKEVVAGEPSVPQEQRKWARLDLSRREGKGILVRATSEDGKPLNGDARNVSAGGICLELPKGERVADEFELKLFFPNRPKPIEAIGKIVWKGTVTRRLPAPRRGAGQAGRLEQLGVAFSAINAPDQEAIKQFVEQRTSKIVTA